MTFYNTVIPTVESRLNTAQELSRFLDAYVVMDSESTSNENHDEAWLVAHATGQCAAWTVVVEDDAVPYTNDPTAFAETLSDVLDNAPTPVVSLYTGKGRPRPLQPRLEAALRRAHHEGSPWLIDKNLHWGVAVAVRTELVSSMLGWVQRCDNPYDERLGMWARGHGHRIAYTVPSLVDHADQPSVIHDDREPGRVAHRVLSRDEVVDWSRPAIWL